MLCAKNYQNPPMFHGVIQKIKMTRFYPDTVYMPLSQFHLITALRMRVIVR